MKIEYRNNACIPEDLICAGCGADDWKIANDYRDGSTCYGCTSCGEAGLIINIEPPYPLETREKDVVRAEEKTQKLLDKAERWLFENKGMAWKDLSEETKNNWIPMYMGISLDSDCLGDRISDVLESRILFIEKYKPNSPEDLILNDSAIQTLDDVREKSVSMGTRKRVVVTLDSLREVRTTIDNIFDFIMAFDFRDESPYAGDHIIRLREHQHGLLCFFEGLFGKFLDADVTSNELKEEQPQTG